MKPKGILLVLSAPSGTGKSTLINMLCRDFPEFGFSVSYTTRTPRPGEVHGKDYFFLAQSEFMELKDQGFFAEWAQVHDNFYGTPKEQILSTLQKGGNLIMDIDVQGARQIKDNLNQGVYLFIFPPSLEVLRSRLVQRGSDSQETIEKRIRNAAHEMLQSEFFDYWLVNNEIQTAYARFKALVKTEMLRPAHNPGLAQKIAAGHWYE